jgi:hypothetical protein
MDIGGDVGTGGTLWLTYEEIARRRRISIASAKRLAQRKRWRRQPGNDGKTRLALTAEEVAGDAGPDVAADAGTDAKIPVASGVGGDAGADVAAGVVAALAAAVADLRGMLTDQVERRVAVEAKVATLLAEGERLQAVLADQVGRLATVQEGKAQAEAELAALRTEAATRQAENERLQAELAVASRPRRWWRWRRRAGWGPLLTDA